MAKKRQSGLGKGLDSLIPDFYNEEFDSNNSISLEEMLNEDQEKNIKENDVTEVNPVSEDKKNLKEKNLKLNKKKPPSDNEIKTEIDKKYTEKETIRREKNKEVPGEFFDENFDTVEKEIGVEKNIKIEEKKINKEKSEDVAKTEKEINKTLTEKEIKNIKEVKEIVNKNPRITLWSSHSAAVFRYLRKTEPEFSISKEGAVLIDEAVSKKYPEIWKLFKEI